MEKWVKGKTGKKTSSEEEWPFPFRRFAISPFP
jgi:hypothetical protein